MLVVTVAQPFVLVHRVKSGQQVIAAEPAAVVCKSGVGFYEVIGIVGLGAVEAAVGKLNNISTALNAGWNIGLC